MLSKISHKIGSFLGLVAPKPFYPDMAKAPKLPRPNPSGTLHKQAVRLSEIYGRFNGYYIDAIPFFTSIDRNFYRKFERRGYGDLWDAELIIRYFSQKWPPELEWPSDIPRPNVLADKTASARNAK